MQDYKCPNCGASFSLPLGMMCSDHRPEPIGPNKPWSEMTREERMAEGSALAAHEDGI